MISGSWLVMSQGPQPGQTFMLDRDWLTLGRDPSNEIVIGDPQISRQHARITRQGKLIVIEDLGSTNGTFVNGMRLTGPHVMANGDVIGLGDAVTLTYYEVGIATEATETIVGRAAAAVTPPAATPVPPTYAPRPAAHQPAPPPAYAAPIAPPPTYPVTPPPPYLAAPPFAVAAPPVKEEKKRRTGLAVGCVIVAVLVVVVACVVVFVLDYLRMLPPIFYEPLRWLGLI
jgi:predicted component of type VI protein secretion system